MRRGDRFFISVFTTVLLFFIIGLVASPVSKAQQSSFDDEIPQLTPLRAAELLDKNIEDNEQLRLSDFTRKETGLTLEQSSFIAVIKTYFDLQTSELKMRAFFETHSSAYVRWARSRDMEKLGRENQIELAGKLALVEKTRLEYHRERSRNVMLRDLLAEIIASEVPDELTNPPPPPMEKPPNLVAHDILDHFEMAKADFKIRHRVKMVTAAVNNAWQATIAARARLDYLQKNFMRAQQVYQQDRTTSMGSAMVDVTTGESELVRATGEVTLNLLRLSFLLEGDDALRSDDGTLNLIALDKSYLFKIKDDHGSDDRQLLTKDGSGFGQDDQ